MLCRPAELSSGPARTATTLPRSPGGGLPALLRWRRKRAGSADEGIDVGVAVAGSCIKVQVDAQSLSFGSCMGHEGANIATTSNSIRSTARDGAWAAGDAPGDRGPSRERSRYECGHLRSARRAVRRRFGPGQRVLKTSLSNEAEEKLKAALSKVAGYGGDEGSAMKSPAAA